MNIYIIGSGTFGTAIANSLAQNQNNNVTLYSRSQQIVYDINQNNNIYGQTYQSPSETVATNPQQGTMDLETISTSNLNVKSNI